MVLKTPALICRGFFVIFNPVAEKLEFTPLLRVARNTRVLDVNAFWNEFFFQEDVQRFIIKLNTETQLFDEGIQATGEPLTSTNSSPGVYGIMAENENRGRSFTVGGVTKTKIAGDQYFLYQEGDFFASFRINLNLTNFVIEAETQKPTNNLLNHGEILGLSDESLQKVIEFFEAFLLVEIRNQIAFGSI